MQLDRAPMGIASLAIVEAMEPRRLLSAGALDQSFGQGGFVAAPENGTVDTVAIQDDGKIVVGGWMAWQTLQPGIPIPINSGEDFLIVRYNPDGSLDSSFGDAGTVTTRITGGYDRITDLLIQDDGRIVALGNPLSGGGDALVVRYNADGSLDGSFGTEGVVQVSLGGSTSLHGEMRQQSDGTLVIAGQALVGTWRPGVLRLNPDGSVAGQFLADFGGSGWFGGMALQDDGRILLTGSQEFNLPSGPVLVGRFMSDGALDASFGAAGWVTLDFAGTPARAEDIDLLSDGDILVAASVDRYTSHLAVARLNADGTPEANFGIAGIAMTDVPLGWTGYVIRRELWVLGNDQLLVAGHRSDSAGMFYSAVTRFNADGSIDTSFGGNGTLATRYGTDLAVQSDGKIVVIAGYTQEPSLAGVDNTHSFNIARYQADPQYRTDVIGCFRDGVFYFDSDGTSGFSAGDRIVFFGIAGDLPFTGDWDGNGTKEVGVFRAGRFYLDTDGTDGWNTASDTYFDFGLDGDQPVVADWNADGIDDVGIYRPSTGEVWGDLDGSRSFTPDFGNNTAEHTVFYTPASEAPPMGGDVNADGLTDLTQFVGGAFWTDPWHRANVAGVFTIFGSVGDRPFIGDFDGDGLLEVGIKRGELFWIDSDGIRGFSAGDVSISFGLAGDVPVG